ncbi:MAG: insulinase family protein [Persephonella sp.]|nr:MAG: insulinase family protein [Persephonella sp.]
MKKILNILIVNIFILILIVSKSYGGDKVIKNITDNRITILFKQTKGQGIIAGTIFIKGGSVEDPNEKKGLTALTMRLLLKGSKNYSAYNISKLFEDSGGYISTSTAEEYTTIDFALRTKDLKRGLLILKDIIYNPSFPEDKLEIEKNNLIASLKARKEDAFSYGYDELRKLMYKDTPYQYSPAGKIEDIKGIKREDLIKRWKELLEGSRWVISFVGDISYREVEKDIKDTFGDIPSKINYKYPIYNYEIKGESCKTLKREGAQSTILVAYNSPSLKEKEYFATKVLNGVLGSGFTSRLFQDLREKRGLAYAIGSFYPTRINMGRLIAYIGTAPNNTEIALKGIREVVNSLKNGVSEEELKTSKEKIIGSFLLDHQTRAKQSWYLGWFETLGLGYEMDKKYTDYIMKVKESDILDVYNKYITKGNVCVKVVP